MNLLEFLNFSSVLLFGIVLTLSFSGLSFRKDPGQYSVLFLVFGLIQALAYSILGSEFLFKAYPVLIHLPLFLVVKFYYKKQALLAGISIFSAYLFCTPRKWIGTFISLFWGYDANISYIVQIAITLPLLFIIVKWVAPYVVRLKYENSKTLKLIIAVPMLYYFIEYTLTVYTNLLYTGGAAIVEFMDAAVVIIYFVFTVIFLKTLYEKAEMKLEYMALRVMENSFSKEIEMLRESQMQAVIHRHDLRHHLSLLYGFAEGGNIDKIKGYLLQAQRTWTKLHQSCFVKTTRSILCFPSLTVRQKGGGHTAHCCKAAQGVGNFRHRALQRTVQRTGKCYHCCKQNRGQVSTHR
ncbi:hypothetical protein N752_16140 [Desulforamulus aquiferis]|nr:hypothetical protein [Desulforamulus aquiferis]RYD04111.1 hypothetical protein N752_16140 [Desulforamulus aquiferis]